MRLKDIKIGMKLRIVGNKGGCDWSNAKCVNCQEFKDGIIVTDIVTRKRGCQGQVVGGTSISNKNEHCHFHPDDLEQLTISNWQEVLE